MDEFSERISKLILYIELKSLIMDFF